MNQPAPRELIVNADDFGMTEAINRGILHAHEHGIVTSTSLMVRADFAPHAVRLAQHHPRLSLGLHVDLGEWTYQDEQWVHSRHVVDPSNPSAVAVEIASQLQTFRRLTGRDPTHFDSHQHVHRRDPSKSILLATALQLNIPLRLFDPRIRHCFAFHGQTAEGAPLANSITVDALLKILHSLPHGITELGCHPGRAAGLDSVYAAERELEIQTLTDPRIRTALADLNIKLISFHDLARAPRSTPPTPAPTPTN